MVAEHGRGHDAAAETVRVEGARILATLIRTVGDVQMAEDAVQEATLAALCPVTGVPPQPRAWLTVTARRKAIDILRRERARPGKERDGLRMIELARSDPDHTSEVEVVFIAEAPRRTALSWNTATSTGTDPAGRPSAKAWAGTPDGRCTWLGTRPS